MDSPFSPAILLFIFLLVSSSPNPSVGLDEISTEQREEGIVLVGRRHLMSFKETPIGTNITYDCSPSGPCVPCTYSEKVLLFFLFQFDNFDDYFIFYSNACIV